MSSHVMSYCRRVIKASYKAAELGFKTTAGFAQTGATLAASNLRHAGGTIRSTATKVVARTPVATATDKLKGTLDK